jgi:glycosyltransferase involved in cell wall biosynthesis
MAQYVSVCRDIPTVMDVQDSASVSAYRAIHTQRSVVKKLQALLRWLSWVRYEKQAYSRFNQVLVLTEQDRYGLTLFSPSLPVTVCRPAMDFPIRERVYAPITNRIVYLGLLSRGPNVDAVEYFLGSVLPLVHLRNPSATVAIAGRGAPPNLLRYQSKTVEFLGFVEDLDKLLQEAAVVVVPLLSGGGIKIKVLEAMARGCAVVSTSIGAEDTGAVHGESILIADNAVDFADCVLKVMSDHGLQAKLGTNAIELTKSRFNWEASGKAFEQTLIRVVDKAAATAASL